MDRERFQQVKQLVLAALDQTPGSRAEFLAAACGSDSGLRTEVESLLPEGGAEWTDRFLAPVPLASPADLAAADELPSRVGMHVGSYELLELIDAGGMGEVYRARRTDDFQQIVAVKLVRHGMVTGETLRRFKNEMQLLASLGEHPHIARLMDAGTTEDGLPYFVMEHVDGLPIDRHCDEHRLGIRRRLELFRTVCGAVQFAHRHAVIHRDIKPSNILVAPDGSPKLIDFGIAKLTAEDGQGQALATNTASQLRVFTPHYASPEQMRGEGVTTATDVYSLGVVLYELLSGRRPYEFSSQQRAEWATIVCEENPRKPSTVVADHTSTNTGEVATEAQSAEEIAAARGESPRSLVRALRGDLDNIVLMALRKDPARRYASVEQFAEDISRHLNRLPVRARPDSFGYRASRFLRRNRLAAGLAFLIVTSLVVGIVGTASQAVRARRSALAAEEQAERANREAAASQSVTTFLAELYESAAPHSMAGLRFGMPRSLSSDLESRQELSAKNTKLIIDELSAKPELQARLLDAIANAYVGMGRIDEAGPLLNQSRAILQNDPTASDVDVARNLRNIAWLRFMQGRYREAEQPLRKVLAIDRATFGESHEETLQTKLHLAILLASLEAGHNEAEALLRDVIDVRRETLGKQHPRVAFALLALSLVHASAQQQRRAIGPAMEAAQIFAAHPETTEVSQGIMGIATAVVQAQLGNKQSAVDRARKSLERMRQLLGDDHPLVANQALFIPRTLEQMGDSAEAQKMYHQTLEQLRSRHEEKSYLYARNIERLGIIAAAAERNDEAEPYLREALAIYRRALRDDSWRVGWVLAQLGIVHRQKGEYEKAIAILSQAVDVFERVAAGSPLNSAPWCQSQLEAAKRLLAEAEQ